jgi:hypothetical protein
MPGELTFADTSAMTGYITFSTTAIERGLRDGSESGYPCEEHCLERYCSGRLKEDYLMWLVLHEFTHLLVGSFAVPLLACAVIGFISHLPSAGPTLTRDRRTGFNNDRHDREFFERVSAFADQHSFLFDP